MNWGAIGAGVLVAAIFAGVSLLLKTEPTLLGLSLNGGAGAFLGYRWGWKDAK